MAKKESYVTIDMLNEFKIALLSEIRSLITPAETKTVAKQEKQEIKAVKQEKQEWLPNAIDTLKRNTGAEIIAYYWHAETESCFIKGKNKTGEIVFSRAVRTKADTLWTEKTHSLQELLALAEWAKKNQ